MDETLKLAATFVNYEEEYEEAYEEKVGIKPTPILYINQFKMVLKIVIVLFILKLVHNLVF